MRSIRRSGFANAIEVRAAKYWPRRRTFRCILEKMQYHRPCPLRHLRAGFSLFPLAPEPTSRESQRQPNPQLGTKHERYVSAFALNHGDAMGQPQFGWPIFFDCLLTGQSALTCITVWSCHAIFARTTQGLG